jgi:hypothetical protein
MTSMRSAPCSRSLARHLRREGDVDEARGLVTSVHATFTSTFTEGFETHELVATRELLEQLGS